MKVMSGEQVVQERTIMIQSKSYVRITVLTFIFQSYLEKDLLESSLWCLFKKSSMSSQAEIAVPSCSKFLRQ